MTAICIDNTGVSYTYGPIYKILDIGEKVEVLYQTGSCMKIRKSNGEEYTLYQGRFA